MTSLRVLAAVVLVVVASTHPHAAAATTNTTDQLSAAATTTAYDVLEQHDLPRGILPEGVQSYVLRPDGSMEVTLPGECDFFVTVAAAAGQRYKLRYGATVGGVVEAGSVRDVYGVRMQVKFAWLGLNGVRRRAGDQLELRVGEEFAQSFPVADFVVSPRCI